MKKHTIKSNKKAMSDVREIMKGVDCIKREATEYVLCYMTGRGLIPTDWKNMLYDDCGDIYTDISLFMDSDMMYCDSVSFLIKAVGYRLKKNGEKEKDSKVFTCLGSDRWIKKDSFEPVNLLFLETLGDLRDLLVSIDKDTKVVVNIDGEKIMLRKNCYCHSYRGYYQDVAMTYIDDGDHMDVGILLKKIENAIGASYTGWKGGDFDMDENSKLWFSEEGRSEGFQIESYEVGERLILNLRKNK